MIEFVGEGVTVNVGVDEDVGVKVLVGEGVTVNVAVGLVVLEGVGVSDGVSVGVAVARYWLALTIHSRGTEPDGNNMSSA